MSRKNYEKKYLWLLASLGPNEQLCLDADLKDVGIAFSKINALESEGIYTLRDLIKLPYSELEYRCGNNSIRRICRYLARILNPMPTPQDFEAARKRIDLLPQDIYYKSIKQVRCSRRLSVILERIGIEVVGDLATLDFITLKSTPNCGSATIRELYALMRNLCS